MFWALVSTIMYSRLMYKIMLMELGLTSTCHSTQSCQLGSGELVMCRLKILFLVLLKHYANEIRYLLV